MKTPLHKMLIGLALAAALAAPIAAAKAPDTVTVPAELAYIQGPGGNNNLSQFENYRGGPGGVGIVDTEFAPKVATNGGFDWVDAAVGAGFAAGIALIVGAALLARGRRRPLAHA
jgi:hypothetical protein